MLNLVIKHAVTLFKLLTFDYFCTEMSIRLFIDWLSNNSDNIVWGGLCVLFVLFIWSIILQIRQGKNLRYELEQLDKMKENNVESEFVLKAMKLATWHLDPKTMTITFDSDFRDKSAWVAPYNDGTGVGELEQQIDPDDMEHVSKAMADICSGLTDNYHVEYKVPTPTPGKYYWEESYATIVDRGITGKPTSIVGTTMRIDDRKLMETELIEARNKAEESDRLKSAFIANMSHEIRTPLNAIIGFTSVLNDLPDGPERKQLMELIHENTQKLLIIIDDVVNISKIESGQEEAVITTFELNQVLTDICERYRKDLKNGVELNTVLTCQELLVNTDLNRLTEIIKHLLSNAIKFTEKGSIEVGYKEPENGRLKLWVKDTGKGIDQQKLEKVFERFFKVDEFIPGAGLGLSICRTMAFSLGGTVTAESKLGEGSTFWVDIPMQ